MNFIMATMSSRRVGEEVMVVLGGAVMEVAVYKSCNERVEVEASVGVPDF